MNLRFDDLFDVSEEGKPVLRVSDVYMLHGAYSPAHVDAKIISFHEQDSAYYAGFEKPKQIAVALMDLVGNPIENKEVERLHAEIGKAKKDARYLMECLAPPKLPKIDSPILDLAITMSYVSDPKSIFGDLKTYECILAGYQYRKGGRKSLDKALIDISNSVGPKRSELKLSFLKMSFELSVGSAMRNSDPSELLAYRFDRENFGLFEFESTPHEMIRDLEWNHGTGLNTSFLALQEFVSLYCSTIDPKDIRQKLEKVLVDDQKSGKPWARPSNHKKLLQEENLTLSEEQKELLRGRLKELSQS